MGRLFSWLAAATVFMLLSAGFGVYWLLGNEIAQAKENAVAAEARSVAQGLSAQIGLLNNTLDKMAQDPDVLSAVNIGNNGLLKVVSERLEKYIPDILKIRILLPGVNEIDEISKPRMGFADLDMVRETLTHNQPPSIQGDKGTDRHLAIARGIVQDGKVVGVILASLDENIILKNLRLIPIKKGYFELKQGQLLLGTFGKKEGAEADEPKHVNILNTDWVIHYQYSESTDFGNLSITLAIIIVPALVTLLLFFTGHRWLSNVLTQDLESLMKAFKDLMTNTARSNYPVELTEMHAAISNLMQFKRVLDYGDRETSVLQESGGNTNILVSDDEDFGLDDFFDDNDFKL